MGYFITLESNVHSPRKYYFIIKREAADINTSNENQPIIVAYSQRGYTHPACIRKLFSEIEQEIKIFPEPFLGKVKQLLHLKKLRDNNSDFLIADNLVKEIRELKANLPCFCLSKLLEEKLVPP